MLAFVTNWGLVDAMILLWFGCALLWLFYCPCS